MSKHSGAAFSKPTDDAPATPDVTTFDPRAWARGTAPVTRSVAVCGRPDLMGHIEALKDELERAQAAEFDDHRPLARSHAMDLAQALEACRRDMLASMATFTFRGLRPGELEAMKAEHGADEEPEGISDLDYKVWARQCIKIQLEERRDYTLTEREQRELVRNILREKKSEEAFILWAQELRARAYVEYRDQTK